MHSCTGKPQELGRIPRELGTTGYGVSVALDTTFDFLKDLRNKNNNVLSKIKSKSFSIYKYKKKRYSSSYTRIWQCRLFYCQILK
jgi:hypothetical protein